MTESANAFPRQGSPPMSDYGRFKIPVCELLFPQSLTKELIDQFPSLAIYGRRTTYLNADGSVRRDEVSIEIGSGLLGVQLPLRKDSHAPGIKNFEDQELEDIFKFCPKVKGVMRVREASSQSIEIGRASIICDRDGLPMGGTSARPDRILAKSGGKEGRTTLWIRSEDPVFIISAKAAPAEVVEGWQKDNPDQGEFYDYGDGVKAMVTVQKRAWTGGFDFAARRPEGQSAAEWLKTICMRSAPEIAFVTNQSVMRDAIQAALDKARCEGDDQRGCNHIHFGFVHSKAKKEGERFPQESNNMTNDNVLKKVGATPFREEE